MKHSNGELKTLKFRVPLYSCTFKYDHNVENVAAIELSQTATDQCLLHYTMFSTSLHNVHASNVDILNVDILNVDNVDILNVDNVDNVDILINILFPPTDQIFTQFLIQ